MTQQIHQGSVVESLMGHDKGRWYLIVNIDGEFAFLVDGEYRLLDRPKKKRLKHIKSLNVEPLILETHGAVHDFEIKKHLKSCKNV